MPSPRIYLLALSVVAAISWVFLHGEEGKSHQAPAPAAAKTETPELQLDAAASIEKKNGEHLLRLKLTNRGDEFECFQSKLPWSHWHSMRVVIAWPFDSNALKAIYPIDDPVTGFIKFKRGETREGTVNLDSRFPDLAKTLKLTDLILFWNFKLKDLDDKKAKRLGGWIHMPKE